MVAASVYMIVFRAFHILAGVAWVGGLTLLALYLQPSAKAIGPAAGPFMRELVMKRRLPNYLLGMGAVTIVAGGFVYWHDWDAFGSLGDFVGTAFGTALTVGALVAVVAWVIGLVAVKPATMRAMALAGQLASAGAPPTPEQMAEVQAAQRRARRLTILVLVLLVIAVLAMATARYW
jgi:uncharacterized membrane protein